MKGTLLERYWAKVDKRGPDECWPWVAGGSSRGYGVIHVGFDADHNKVVSKAHRLGWELANGRSAGALLVRHRCDNPPCQNPAHLELGTQLDNMRDRRERGKYQGVVTEQEVRQIRVMGKVGYPLGDIAERFGVNKSLVSQIVRRETWRHV